METAKKTTKRKTTKKETDSEEMDARVKIKPRGLCGLYEGKMFLNGTSNEVFNLGM